MAKHKNLDTFEAHSLRLNLNFSAEGAAPGTLAASCRVDGVAIPATVTDAVVMFDPMPAGQHLYEVLAGQTLLMYGHLCVKRGAFDPPAGAVTEYYEAVAEDGVTINIVLGEGAPGAPGKDGITEEEVETMLASGTEAVTLSTPTGTDNGTCNYVELDSGYSFEGELTAISFRTGTNTTSGMTTDPLWLAVWELVEGSTSVYELAGVSVNSITQEVNSTPEWQFEGVTLHGRRLRLVPTTDDAVTEPDTAVKLRVRTAGSTDSSTIINGGTTYSYTPQMTLGGMRTVPRFADAAELAEHVGNTAAHVSENAVSVLACFEWDTTYGLSLIHTTDGVIDGRLRLMVSAGAVNLVSGYPVTLQAAQVGVVSATEFHTKTDTDTGISYNFSGHTLSDTEMQAYGITVPCVWCGDPALPLLLRGSEIRLNGTAINVETLIQLLVNANALLALIDPIDG